MECTLELLVVQHFYFVKLVCNFKGCNLFRSLLGLSFVCACDSEKSTCIRDRPVNEYDEGQTERETFGKGKDRLFNTISGNCGRSCHVPHRDLNVMSCFCLVYLSFLPSVQYIGRIFTPRIPILSTFMASVFGSLL